METNQQPIVPQPQPITPPVIPAIPDAPHLTSPGAAPVDHSPQSQTPLNAPEAAQEQQTATVQAPAQHSDRVESSSTFTSNPFAALGKGLGSLLTVNPVSGIMINLWFLLVAIPYVVMNMLTPLFLTNDASFAVVALVVGLAGLVISVLIALRATAGLFYIYNKSHEKQTVTTKEAFLKGGGGKLLSIVAAAIIAGVFIFIGFIFFIIPGLILLARLSLFPFVLFAENASPTDSLKRSMKLTKGHTFEMLGAIFAGSFVSGNGLLSPVLQQAPLANRYFELLEHEQKGMKTGKVSGWNYILVLLPVLIMAFVIFTFSLAFTTSINSNDNTEFQRLLEEEFNNNFEIQSDFDAPSTNFR